MFFCWLLVQAVLLGIICFLSRDVCTIPPWIVIIPLVSLYAVKNQSKVLSLFFLCWTKKEGGGMEKWKEQVRLETFQALYIEIHTILFFVLLEQKKGPIIGIFTIRWYLFGSFTGFLWRIQLFFFRMCLRTSRRKLCHSQFKPSNTNLWKAMVCWMGYSFFGFMEEKRNGSR